MRTALPWCRTAGANGCRSTKRNDMSLAHLLKPAQLVQAIALALSIFNLVAFLWLTFTVWLNGDRRAGITRLGVVGLGLSALFFFLHAVLISSPLLASPTSTAEWTFMDVL